MPDTDKTYDIGGRTFHLRSPSWGQSRWLAERLEGQDMAQLEGAKLIEILRKHFTAILAIMLIEEGQTPLDKIKGGKAKVQELEDYLDAMLDPETGLAMVADFFAVLRPQALWMLVGASTLDGLVPPSTAGRPLNPVLSP